MYDSLYWTKTIPIDQIQKQLRIYGQGYTSMKIVDAWVFQNGLYGLPRQWAKSRNLPGQDKTLLVPAKWPKFRGTYKYNQEACCQKLQLALTRKYGALLESPTGWGKTVAALDVAARMGQKTLVLVHKADLMGQWKESARQFFGMKCGTIQQDEWDYDYPLTVAMVQTLRSRQISPEFARSFGMIIVDEGHHTPCETVSQILGEMPARYRLGVSATWRRTDKLDDLWKWHIGEIEARGERKTVPAKYYQQTVKIPVDDKKFMQHGNINHAKLVTWMAENPDYNEYIIGEINRAAERGRHILVVSHRISQVEFFFRKIPNSGVYVGKFNGKILEKEELELAKSKQVILATYKKIEEGTDIPRLDTLFLATPCSDPEQVVGRVCRDHQDKKNVIIVDLVLPHFYGYAMAKKRQKVYANLGIEKG